MKLEFFAPGTPRPQGSKKPVGHGVYIESSRHLPVWRKTVMTTAQAARRAQRRYTQETGALCLQTLFVMPRPKSLKGKPTRQHTCTPDLDKLQRAIGDALTQAAVIRDDSQIVEWHAAKRYAYEGETAGAHITLTSLPAYVEEVES